MDAATIRSIVDEIRGDSSRSGDVKRNYYKGKYFQFVNDMPKLFEASLNPDFPINKYLDLMLAQYTKLTTQDSTVDDADQIVYGQLRSDYVDPLVNAANAKGISPEVSITQV